MAENHLPLAQILAGISGLKTKEELDAVRDAMKEVESRPRTPRTPSVFD